MEVNVNSIKSNFSSLLKENSPSVSTSTVSISWCPELIGHLHIHTPCVQGFVLSPISNPF